MKFNFLFIVLLISFFMNACVMYYKGKDLISHHKKVVKETSKFNKKVNAQLDSMKISALKEEISKSAMPDSKKVNLASQLDEASQKCRQSNDNLIRLRSEYDTRFTTFKISKKRKYELSSEKYKAYKATQQPALKLIRSEASKIRKDCGKLNKILVKNDIKYVNFTTVRKDFDKKLKQSDEQTKDFEKALNKVKENVRSRDFKNKDTALLGLSNIETNIASIEAIRNQLKEHLKYCAQAYPEKKKTVFFPGSKSYKDIAKLKEILKDYDSLVSKTQKEVKKTKSYLSR